MNCPRCAGLMEKIDLFDFKFEIQRPIIGAWHCINCGEILDHLIVFNREVHPEVRFSGVRNKNRYGLRMDNIKIKNC